MEVVHLLHLPITTNAPIALFLDETEKTKLFPFPDCSKIWSINPCLLWKNIDRLHLPPFCISYRMSPLLDEMESDWLTQLRSMREAIAELRLDQRNREGPIYGHDLVLDDGDVTGESGSDDVWDVWSDQEEEESSDVPDSVDENAFASEVYESRHDREWLRSRCKILADTRTGLNAAQLEEQVSNLLASNVQGS